MKKNVQKITILFFILLTGKTTILVGNDIPPTCYSNLFDQVINSSPHSKSIKKKSAKKPWTIIVYLAADNDLRGFAARNLKQMSTVGSNQYVNIVAHLDIRMNGNKKVTRRYYIENNRILHMNADDPATQQMDSGDPSTLISCCEWAIKEYPAENYMLVFWNHGTGIIDPVSSRIVNSTDLFTFNSSTNKLELDRSIGFLDLIELKEQEDRGICWDDSTGHYLTNQKLEDALAYICKNLLNGKKFSIIGFDACLMSMLEIANIVRPYADIMVSSQEVELSTGWDYQRALSPFLKTAPSKANLAKHIVSKYEESYLKITNDYTQSALALEYVDELEVSIDKLARILLECIKKQTNSTVKNAIKASSNKLLCTHFDEPSYIDLHHFLTNLAINTKHFSFENKNEETILKKALQDIIDTVFANIKKSVLSFVSGKNVAKAQGISIYFPEKRIHSSYRKTKFAKNNEWITLLNQILLT